MNNPAVKSSTSTASPSTTAKSGLKKFTAGELLFKEKDIANSLYIIQKGQIRLFIPKGKGHVELAILRAGEVIGEMAYFDEDSRRRSCSAQAITAVEVVEISFPAFEKTLQGLNPWFKTIINTLADRLRKTNTKVKQLESNAVSLSASTGGQHYKFFNNQEVIRLLSGIFLIFKAHGVADTQNNKKIVIFKKVVKMYLLEIFSVGEVKLEEFLLVLQRLSLIDLVENQGEVHLFTTQLEVLKNLVGFVNTERTLTEEKQLKISPACQVLLEQLVLSAQNQSLKLDANGKVMINVSTVLESIKSKYPKLSQDDLSEARMYGLCGDLVVGEKNHLFCDLVLEKTKKILPNIKFINEIKRVNQSKAT